MQMATWKCHYYYYHYYYYYYYDTAVTSCVCRSDALMTGSACVGMLSCDGWCVLQYSVLLLLVFLLEAGSGVVTYLYEINVSFTCISPVCSCVAVECTVDCHCHSTCWRWLSCLLVHCAICQLRFCEAVLVLMWNNGSLYLSLKPKSKTLV